MASVTSTSPNPGLVQTGPGQWTTTVMVDTTSPSCPGPVTSYWLQTISPDGMIQGTVINPDPKPKATATPKRTATPAPSASPKQSAVTASKNGSSPAPGSTCEVTVQFTGLHQTPVSAVLAIDQPGSSVSLQLTVSRAVTLLYYLCIPVIAGAALALAVVVFAMLRVKIYDPDARRLRPWQDRRHYWSHPLTAAGAWSSNDSWATNISGGLVVVGSLLAALPVSSAAFFPGVALDRFIPVTLAVGLILAAAPLAFGILYTRWTAHDPAATADAILSLPTGVQALVARRAEATLAPNTALRIGGENQQLNNRLVARLAPGTVAAMSGTEIRLAADTTVRLPAGTTVTPRPVGDDAPWWVLGWGLPGWFRRTTPPADSRMSVLRAARARLKPVYVRLPADQAATLVGDATFRLRPGTRVQGSDGTVFRLIRPAEVTLDPEVANPLVAKKLARKAWVTIPDEVLLARGTTGTVSRRAARTGRTGPGLPDPVTIMLPEGATAEFTGGVTASLALLPRTTELIVVRAGATITVAGDATVAWTKNEAGKEKKGNIEKTVQSGKGIQVPPGSQIAIRPTARTRLHG